MAGDLIPPPSPAGRPTPDAPRLIELPPEPPPAPAESAPAEPVGPSQFRHRFGFVTGALIGVLVAAAGVLAIALTTGGDSSKEGLARNWSTWKPADTDSTSGAQEIADHVAPKYRLDDGTQLVDVRGGPLEIQSTPLSVALRAQGSNIQLLSGGHAVLYTLNGLGPHGSIITGKPTNQRGLLVRREALELALYSFRYLKDVDMVVALLPPPPPKKGASASADSKPPLAEFYRPGDLLPQLKVPLRVTLSPTTPRPSTMPQADARRVLSLTSSNVFQASVQQAQDTRFYLVLDRTRG
jgi:hypothetical protein